MSRIMYREMKDSDKEKESGKMVRPTSVSLFYGYLIKAKEYCCSFWNATLKKTNSFQLLKEY